MKCNGSVTVPAFSEVIIEGESALKMDTKYGLVSPLYGCDQDIMVGHTLVDPHRSDMGIPIRVLNPSSSDVILHEGEKVAVLNEVDEVKSGPDFAEQTAQCDNSESSKSCADMKLPQHLSDLFECSSKRLNHHEKEQLRLLLIKHSDVFS